MPATTTAAKYDRVTDAFTAYARENDNLSASEYWDEGTALAESAFDHSAPDGRDTFIETALEDFPESARYLIACAADYRLAELAAAPERRAAA